MLLMSQDVRDKSNKAKKKMFSIRSICFQNEDGKAYLLTCINLIMLTKCIKELQH